MRTIFLFLIIAIHILWLPKTSMYFTIIHNLEAYTVNLAKKWDILIQVKGMNSTNWGIIKDKVLQISDIASYYMLYTLFLF